MLMKHSEQPKAWKGFTSQRFNDYRKYPLYLWVEMTFLLTFWPHCLYTAISDSDAYATN